MLGETHVAAVMLVVCPLTDRKTMDFQDAMDSSIPLAISKALAPSTNPEAVGLTIVESWVIPGMSRPLALLGGHVWVWVCTIL